MDFEPKDRVLLVCCPHGEPAVVEKVERGRVHVFWSDLKLRTAHRPERLELVERHGDFQETYAREATVDAGVL